VVARGLVDLGVDRLGDGLLLADGGLLVGDDGPDALGLLVKLGEGLLLLEELGRRRVALDLLGRLARAFGLELGLVLDERGAIGDDLGGRPVDVLRGLVDIVAGLTDVLRHRELLLADLGDLGLLRLDLALPRQLLSPSAPIAP